MTRRIGLPVATREEWSEGVMQPDTLRRLAADYDKFRSAFAGPGVGADELDAAAARLGVPLPADYREFVSRFGGGHAGSQPRHCTHVSMKCTKSSLAGAPSRWTERIAAIRPRGDRASSPVTRNVGQCGRHSPQATHIPSSSSSR